MLVYFFKRILTTICTLFLVITLTFFLMRLMPGGPFDGEKNIPPKIKIKLEEKFGLNKPLSQQYISYVKDLSKCDLGPSMKREGRSVNWIIGYSFPTSAKLGLVAVLISLTIGIALGILAALNFNRWPDSICMLLSTLGVTIPSFVVGVFLMYIFGVKLKMVPIVGLKTWDSYILPSVALSGYSIAFIARLTRSKLVEVMKSDYIRTARAKGLSKTRIIIKHALRNTLIPIVTYLGPLVAGILTGSFVIEKIFAIPGLGSEFVTTITNRDYTVILGVTIFYSAFLMVCNLIVDLLYVVIDPRIKLDK
ncbi:ABC transporter permease [uncultured Cetobacterium sp.]|uniref:ABC transporter permease n=1 Tax=uncultured Cetobacterium sp. TaxID=527638 RepID=UPI0025F01868|nr:ABC transporter permease [uncultured Cetobacterium sp.]